MSMASGRWLGVRLDLVAALLIGAVALAAVLTSQDAGNYVLKKAKPKLIFQKAKGRNKNIFSTKGGRWGGGGSHIKRF